MAQSIFSAKEAKNNFGRLLDEARLAPVTIEKNGKKVAVLMSVEDYEEEFASAEFWKEIDASRKSGKVSSTTIEKQLGL
jgi:prevent-host-death family protein